MKEMSCEVTRERIPDVAGERSVLDVEAFERHVEACVECRAELELARLLRAARPEAPAGSARRVVDAVRRDRAARGRPWWGLTAAAVVAVALGVGIVSDAAPPGPDADVPSYAYEVEEGTIWSSEDGLVAGAPSLDALSDEALRQLLDELSTGGAGGAV